MIRKEGFAIVTALSLMLVVVAILGILMAGTVSELKQTRASLELTQSRAVAEAGEVYARYVLETSARKDIKNTIRPYISVDANPETSWIVSDSKWSTLEQAIENNLNASYGTLASSATNGIGSATISYDLKNFRGGTRSATSQTYIADYTIVSKGEANGGIRHIEDKGSFEIQLGRPSLSQYLFLVDDAQGDRGFFPTGSVFNGPVHANHNWGFWGKPEFRDVVSTADSSAWYWHLSRDGCTGSSKTQIAGDSRPPCTVPQFDKGFLRNAEDIELPTSTLSQERAALGMSPDDPSSPSDRETCRALGLHNPPLKNCNSNSSVPDGVYIPSNGINVAGGIYVKGDLDSLKVDASSRNGIQVYTLTQGGNTWTITVDYSLNTTTILDSSGLPKVLSGTPNGPAPITGGATGQIYVEGEIKDLKGPGRSGSLPSNPPDHPVPSQILPALAKETQLNITATNKIGLTSDLVYECDPTAVGNSSYLASYPRCNTGDALLPTVLGVMSATDNVDITTSTPDDLYLWGSYFSGADGKGLTVENYSSRPAQGKLRVFGGLIQSVDQYRGQIYSSGALANGYLETFDYDLRFANGVIAPPNFPTVRTFDVQTINPVKLSFREY